ncbi:MAG: DegV family EDD domain-containing protein [Lachnospiraceae bacterium]|nr:DegV family EDD domain-containing protein [Lachnospiraceae bacterium]
MLKYMKKMVASDDLSIREKIFRIICVEAQVVTIASLLEELVVATRIPVIICILLILGIITLAQYMVIRNKAVNLAINIVGVGLILIALPSIFFASGGVEGGMGIWFAMGMYYIFLMYDGKALRFFVIFNTIIDVTCYYVAFHYPTLLARGVREGTLYLDNVFAVTVVGITAGFLFIFQYKLFEYQKRKSDENEERLEELAHSRERFYANFSHEIRNPINAMVGLNEIILRDSCEPETLVNSMTIKRSAKLLLNLVNDIMDLSQISNNSMELVNNEYNTRELFKEILGLIKSRAEEKKLKLEAMVDPSLPATMIGDERRLIQIVLNLLTNGVKYTPEGMVRLEVYALEKTANKVKLKITVTDTGIGIKKENIGSLFDSYRQFDRNINSKIEGNGLGLAITRELVSLMGGEITVDSIYTKGSTFTVILDQGYVGEELIGDTEDFIEKDDEVEAYQKTFEAPRARILVIDDDEINRRIIQKLLEPSKMTVDEATDGKTALQLTRETSYDIIFTDYIMPGMNGAELLKEIRNQKGGMSNNAVIIALTGLSINSDMLKGASGGFDNTLQKPVEAKMLDRLMVEYLPDELVSYKSEEMTESMKGVVPSFAKERKRSILITTDRTSDLPTSLIESLGIRVMDIYVRTARGKFVDSLEINYSSNIAEYVQKGEIVPESASIDEYEQFFGNGLDEAEEIIHIATGSRFGSCYSNAMKAAEGFDHVSVIDSNNVSGGIGILVLAAVEMAGEGKSADEIIEMINGLKYYVDMNAVIPSTAYFQRIGSMGPLVGRLLGYMHVRPSVHIGRNKIHMTLGFETDTDNAIRKHIKRNMWHKSAIDTDRPIIYNYSGLNARQVEEIKQEMTHYIQSDRLYVHRSSVSVSGMVGVGSFAVTYFKKNPYNQ